MFLAASASLRSPDSKAFHDRERAEGKRHNTPIICLGRRRCGAIIALLHANQPSKPPPPNSRPGAQSGDPDC